MKKKKPLPHYIARGEGVFLADLATRLGVHKNTIKNWAERFGIHRGLMMGEHKTRKQAMTVKDVKRFEKLMRKVGAIDGAV